MHSQFLNVAPSTVAHPGHAQARLTHYTAEFKSGKGDRSASTMRFMDNTECWGFTDTDNTTTTSMLTILQTTK